MRSLREQADLPTATLLKIVLVLIAVWLALEIVDTVFHVFAALLGAFVPLVGLVIVAALALWLYGRL
ncbi:MAG: hypothetical protein ABEJ28_05670 [Salinigranum sp.]